MKSNVRYLLLFTLVATTLAARKPHDRPRERPQKHQEKEPESSELSDECPEPNGFFADAYQCDKYYECREGAITEKLCPDGMVFNDFSIQHEKCDLPFNIDCSQKSQLQQPKPSTHCPRQNGYFAHEDAKICDKFYFCVDGKFNMITCPNGLVYNEKTGICTWPDEAKKKHCSSEAEHKTQNITVKRTKRLSFWKDDENDKEYGDSYEEGDYSDSGEEDEDEDDGDYDFGSYENSEEEGGKKKDDEFDDFPSDPAFSNFDVDFNDFDKSSKEDSSSAEMERRDDVLDDYINKYVKKLNSNLKPDLRYYERIAEKAVEEELAKEEANKRPKRSIQKRRGRTCKDVSKKKITSVAQPHCRIAKVFNFGCPKVNMTTAQQHPRYPDPEDCQFFYVCINGEVPRRNGCKKGQVFNELSGSCDWPRNVPECREWYKGILTDEELEALENPKPRVRNNSAAAAARRKRPHQPVPNDDESK